MALVLADRVKETTTTTGTGTYTLAGAATGFESFSVVGNANTTYYCCTDGTDFEVGIGTYTASGTTLARTTILQSSNSDAAVDWSAGSKDIFVTQPAEKAVFLDGSGNISIPGTIDGRDLATDGTKLDGIDPADYAPAAQTINAQTGTTYTTVLSDAAQLVTLNNASAITLTIPPNSSVAYATGTRIDFIQIGAGQVTVAGGVGVTVNSTPTLKFRAQHSAASCIKIATDTWQLVGDLAES